MDKATAKIAKLQGKDVRTCLDSSANGLLDAAQTDACLLADAKGKIAKAGEKAADVEASKCSPTPSFGFTSASTATRAARTEPLGIAHELFGPSPGDAVVPVATDKTAAKCQARLVKDSLKILDQELKQFSRCKSEGLKAGTITDAASLAACLDTIAGDPTGKIDRAKAKLADAVGQKCVGVDLDAALPGACAGAVDHAACLATRIDCRACLLLSDAGALSADCDLFDDGAANLSCIQCNGAASLCDRPFDEVAYPTSHNAMSNFDEGWIAPNNTRPMTAQMEAGIRSLMLDTWYHGGDAVLCHGGELIPEIVDCAVTGMKPLDAGLGELKAFLDTHPYEVLSIIFESYISEADTAADFAASGLDAYVHTQTPGAPWPTLRELIAAGTRMVVFTDDSSASLPWHLYVWSHAWETHFSNVAPEDLSCDPNRGSTSNPLAILNHFLAAPFPSADLASQVNRNPFFIDRAQQCQAESGDLPNFVTVDFEDIGDLYPVVRRLNNLIP